MLLKKKTIPKYIIEDIEISSDSERQNSDEENSDEENLKNPHITHIMKLIFEACEKYIFVFLFVYI